MLKRVRHRGQCLPQLVESLLIKPPTWRLLSDRRYRTCRRCKKTFEEIRFNGCCSPGVIWRAATCFLRTDKRRWRGHGVPRQFFPAHTCHRRPTMPPATRARNIFTLVVQLGIVLVLATVWLTPATVRDPPVSAIESFDVSVADVVCEMIFPSHDQMLRHRINADTGVAEITRLAIPKG